MRDNAAGSPIIVILDPPLVRLMFAPATNVVCVGPEIVRLCAPAPTLTPPAPDTFKSPEYVPDELPVVLPNAVKETVPAPAPAVAEIESVPFPIPTLIIPIPDTARTLFIVPDDVAPVVFPDADRDMVENAAPAAGADMLTVPFPAPTLIAPIPENARTLLNVPDEVAPVVLPDADKETVEKFTGVAPTIVIEPAPVFRVMFAPAARTMVPVLVAAPVPNADTTLAVDAEIVILCAPAPTLTIPAPDILIRFVCVPDELTVVFPSAVIDTDAV